MAVKLVDLQRDQRTVKVDIPIAEDDDGAVIYDQLVVTYRPSAYTGKTEKELNEILKGDVKSAMGIEFVKRLVISWDLEAEDGSPYPLSEDALYELPGTFIGDVITGVAGDMGKVRGNRTTSSVG